MTTSFFFSIPTQPVDPVRSASVLRLPFYHGYRLIALSQIIRLEAQENYTCFYFSDGSRLTVARTLKKLIARLPSGALLRLHRKHAVNPHFIAGWQPRQQQVQLTNGEKISISRRRISICREFRLKLN